MSEHRPRPEVFRFGVFEVDVRARELRKYGKRVSLQDKPFEVLLLLLEHPGEVVTRDELRHHLWPGDTFVVFDDNLNAAVKKVRDALGDTPDNSRFVETVPRHGYKFVAGLNAAPAAVPVDVAAVPASALECAVEHPPSGPRHIDARGGSISRQAFIAAIAVALGTGIGARWRAEPRTPPPIRIRQLTLSGSDSEPAASPDGQAIAFTSRRDGVSRIWWRLLAGGAEVSLTAGPDRAPRFFPDGASILFLREDGTTNTAWRVPLPGGTPQPVVANVTEADPSPNGQRVVFTRSQRVGRSRETVLGVVDVPGGTERVLTVFREADLASVRWSPHGRTIAAIKRGGPDVATALVFVDVESGSTREIPAGMEPGAYGALAFVGDGSSILVTRSENAQVYMPGALGRLLLHDVSTGRQQDLLFAPNLFGLFRSVDSNGRVDVLSAGRLVFQTIEIRQNLREFPLQRQTSDVPAITTFGNSLDRQPTYSPDGQSIAFSSNRSGNLDIWILGRGMAQPRQFTDDRAHDWDPEFTPDGKHLLWSSTRSGHLEVWMANLDGTGARQITHDGIDAENPTMGDDMDWVVYASFNPENAGIWRIRPNGQDAVRIVEGDADVIPDLPEVSPNGRYALYRRDDRVQQRSTIRVVEIATGRDVPFEIDVAHRLEDPAMNLVWGRARWMPEGNAIVFLAQDASGRAVLFRQAFPGQDSSATRDVIAMSLPRSAVESFGISPDGKRITVSDGFYSKSIMLADGAFDVQRPRRSQ